MDTTKLGIATAKAMDDLEKFQAKGDIVESAYIGAVTIIVALDHKTDDDEPNREMLRDVSTQLFVFSEPEELYIQLGLLKMASNNYASSELEED